MVKIEYYIENDNMSVEEYENQEAKVFILTEEMIKDIMRKEIDLKDGDYIDSDIYILSS